MHDAYELAQNLMVALNSPRSLAVYLLIKYKEYEQIARLKISPSDYVDALTYKIDAQAVNFLRKANLPIEGVDPEATAIRQFFKSEKQCFKTNRRLFAFSQKSGRGRALDVLKGNPDFALDAVIAEMQKHMAFILGRAPTFESLVHPSNLLTHGKNSIVSESGELFFGNGSTNSDAGTFTTVPDKLSSVPTITPQLARHKRLGRNWISTAWGKLLSHYSVKGVVLPGNSFFTVEKTSLTKRGCAKGCSINAAYQLGLGRELRARLRRYGLNLAVAQENHKLMAWYASKDDTSATIDLETASDTISIEAVKLLLAKCDPLWLDLLAATREEMTTITVNKRTINVKLEKWSANGNGYTFELETLIFHVIAYVMCGFKAGQALGPNLRFISQYGDDCIVPTSRAKKVIAAFKWFGFLINENKTFTAGPFRESCGGDFFDGVDVRSFYLKGEIHGSKDLISIANGIHRRFAIPIDGGDYGCFSANAPELWIIEGVKHFWNNLIRLLPLDVRRCKGPRILGDTCINTSNSSSWTTKKVQGMLFVRTYMPVAALRDLGKYDELTHYAAALYGMRAVIRHELKTHVNPDVEGPYVFDIWTEKRYIPHRILDARDVSYQLSWTQIPG